MPVCVRRGLRESINVNMRVLALPGELEQTPHPHGTAQDPATVSFLADRHPTQPLSIVICF